MPAPYTNPNDWSKIGATQGTQDPNDASVVGTYRDAAQEMSPEQKSVLANAPMAPGKTPFSIRGGV